MDFNSLKNVLACFYGIGSPKEIFFSFKIEENSIEIIDGLLNIFSLGITPNFIKSVASHNKSKTLIVFNDYSIMRYYLFFNINNSNFSNITNYMSICFVFLQISSYNALKVINIYTMEFNIFQLNTLKTVGKVLEIFYHL